MQNNSWLFEMWCINYSSCSTEVNHKVQNVDLTGIICQFFFFFGDLVVVYLKYQTSKFYSWYINPTTHNLIMAGWWMHSEQDRVPGEKLLEEQLKHFMDRSIEREREMHVWWP